MTFQENVLLFGQCYPEINDFLLLHLHGNKKRDKENDQINKKQVLNLNIFWIFKALC